jgi:hypothetical protein
MVQLELISRCKQVREESHKMMEMEDTDGYDDNDDENKEEGGRGGDGALGIKDTCRTLVAHDPTTQKVDSSIYVHR